MKKNNDTQNSKTNSILENIKDLYEMMLMSSLQEVKIKLDNFDIKIKRFGKKPKVDDFKEREYKLDYEKQPIEEKEDSSFEEILSPLNGIFYRSPSPGASPFVNEGDVVLSGNVLCIIEAMKVMNEIKADKKYKIIKILCENGTSVSVGTKLFLVEPL